MNDLHPLVRMALAKRDELKQRESTVETLHDQMRAAIERHTDCLNDLTDVRDELAALEDAMTGDQRAELVQAFLAHDAEQDSPALSELKRALTSTNRVNQNTPWGNTIWTQSGSHSHGIGNGGV